MDSSELVEHARSLTNDLRSSDGPLWERLRELLRERELEPNTVVLTEFIPESGGWDCVMVTAEGRVIGFFLAAGQHEDITRQSRNAQLVDWRELRTEEDKSLYGDVIEAGFALISDES